MKRPLCATGLVAILFALAACSPAPPSTSSTETSTITPAQAEVMAQLRAYYFEAARSGDQVLIDTYVDAGFPIDSRTSQGYTALILAAYHGHKSLVQQLIARGADPCAHDGRGSTALMGATFKGEIGVVKLLLDQPCSQPDARNNDGQTAAMYAALAGNGDLIEILRQKGANLSLHDHAGHTAASLARQQGADGVAARIEQSGQAR